MRAICFRVVIYTHKRDSLPISPISYVSARASRVPSIISTANRKLGYLMPQAIEGRGGLLPPRPE